MDKRFAAILAVIVVAFAAILVFSKHSNGGTGTSSNAQPTNHIEGKGAAGVTLVEYGDYECPVCSEYFQAVKNTEAQLNSQIFFQFRNLPLQSIHPNAFAAARAAEAADKQGGFWQMHDLLYQNQDPSGNTGWVADRSNVLNNYFVKYAQQIGLDVNKFKTDYASSAVNDSINADKSAFLNTSYANHDQSKEATPSFFIDGKFYDNSNFVSQTSTGSFRPDVAKFVQVLQAAISAKKN